MATKSLLLLLILFYFASFSLHAQSFGGGPLVGGSLLNTSFIDSNGHEYDSKPGYFFGGFIRKDITGNISATRVVAQAEVLFLNVIYKNPDIGLDTGNYESTLSLSRLQINLGQTIYSGSGFYYNFFLFVNFLVSAKDTYTPSDSYPTAAKGFSTTSSDGFKKIGAGLSSSLGYELNNGLGLRVGPQLSFISIDKISHSLTFSILGGIYFCFGGK